MLDYDMKEQSDYISKQIRMAGEELIRRSEQINLGGLDFANDISINIIIPSSTRSDVKFPEISFEFVCLNKTVLDDYLSR